MEDKTVVCRCEDVTLEEIRELIKEEYCTLDEIKRISRAGMGPCQGRTCRLLLANEIARSLGISVEEIQISTFRPPVKPVKLGIYAGSE